MAVLFRSFSLFKHRNKCKAGSVFSSPAFRRDNVNRRGEGKQLQQMIYQGYFPSKLVLYQCLSTDTLAVLEDVVFLVAIIYIYIYTVYMY
jgi:hypothetical protein